MQEKIKFTKEQMLSAKKYADRRDMVSALMQEDEACTVEEMDKKMEQFKKGKVK